MRKKILIFGAGGHGKSVAEIVLMNKSHEEIYFVDDLWGTKDEVIKIPIVSNIKNIKNIVPDQYDAIAAVGNNEKREEWINLIDRLGFNLISVIHPQAFVSSFSSIGKGTAIMAQAIVGADTKVGRGCIINPNATLDHDSTLGDYGHLGVGVQIAGGVTIGARTWLQAGCSAGYRVTIPENQHYSAGTVFRA